MYKITFTDGVEVIANNPDQIFEWLWRHNFTIDNSPTMRGYIENFILRVEDAYKVKIPQPITALELLQELHKLEIIYLTVE